LRFIRFLTRRRSCLSGERRLAFIFAAFFLVDHDVYFAFHTSRIHDQIVAAAWTRQGP
jgi:hypothetical protein